MSPFRLAPYVAALAVLCIPASLQVAAQQLPYFRYGIPNLGSGSDPEKPLAVQVTPPLVNAFVGQPIALITSVTGAGLPVTFAVSGATTALEQRGLVLGADGSITGTLIGAGTSSFRIRATENGGSSGLSDIVRITATEPIISYSGNPEIYEGMPLALLNPAPVPSTNIPTPTFSFAGPAPDGFSIDQTTGTILGAGPTVQADNTPISIPVTAQFGSIVAQGTFTARVRKSLPDGTVTPTSGDLTPFERSAGTDAGLDFRSSIPNSYWTLEGAPSWLSINQQGHVFGRAVEGQSVVGARVRSFANGRIAYSDEIHIHVVPRTVNLIALSPTITRSGALAQFELRATAAPNVVLNSPQLGKFPAQELNGAMRVNLNLPAVTSTTKYTFQAVASREAWSSETVSSFISISVHPHLTLAGGFTGVQNLVVGEEIQAPPALTTQNALGTVTFRTSPDIALSCPGLQIEPSTGMITGTPSQSCDQTFQYVATDSLDNESATSGTFRLRSVQPDAVLANIPDATFTLGTYQALPPLSVSHMPGTPSYTLTQGTLPGGLSLASSTGVISGTPNGLAGNSGSLRITASNGAGKIAVSNIFSIAVNQPPRYALFSEDPPAPGSYGQTGSSSETALLQDNIQKVSNADYANLQYGFGGATFGKTSTSITGLYFDFGSVKASRQIRFSFTCQVLQMPSQIRVQESADGINWISTIGAFNASSFATANPGNWGYTAPNARYIRAIPQGTGQALCKVSALGEL